MPWYKKTFVPAPNTLQLEMVYAIWGGIAENVYHIKGTGVITDLGLLANKVADAAIAWDLAKLVPLRTSAYALQTVRVRDVGVQDGFAIERAVNQLGSRASQSAPDNVTIAIKWVTGRAGRSYRGRTYHIGLCYDQVASDSLVAGQPAAFTDAYGNLITRMSGLDFTGTGLTAAALSVVSASHNKAARVTADVTPITAAVLADPFTDSQRRRLRGRGK